MNTKDQESRDWAWLAELARLRDEDLLADQDVAALAPEDADTVRVAALATQPFRVDQMIPPPPSLPAVPPDPAQPAAEDADTVPLPALSLPAARAWHEEAVYSREDAREAWFRTWPEAAAFLPCPCEPCAGVRRRAEKRTADRTALALLGLWLVFITTMSRCEPAKAQADAGLGPEVHTIAVELREIRRALERGCK